MERGRILVVDDEPGIRELLATVFKDHHDVVEAPDGATATALLKAGERYELIVSDIRMPGMSGPELLEMVRTIDAAQADRMVFLTAAADTTIARRLDSHTVLRKPFGPRALREFVDRVVTAAQSGYFPKH
jgi:CheY-like chemotaxis protein